VDLEPPARVPSCPAVVAAAAVAVAAVVAAVVGGDGGDGAAAAAATAVDPCWTAAARRRLRARTPRHSPPPGSWTAPGPERRYTRPGKNRRRPSRRI